MSFIARLRRMGLDLLPERAVWAPGPRILWVADLHLGKAASFRAAGHAAPEGADATTLARLGALADALGALRLVVLGDFLHARGGQTSALHEALTGWTRKRPALECLVVRGNHDRRAGDAPADCGFSALDEPHGLAGVEGRHHPLDRDAALSEGPIVLAGHVHPQARLSGRGRDSLRLPCFAIQGRQIVLPAFGEFTGGRVLSGDGDWAFVATTDRDLYEISGLPA